MTAPAKHTRSIHVDAPVEKVFGYVAEPKHFVASMPEESHSVLGGKVKQTPDGVVTEYQIEHREFGRHMTTTVTRAEYVPNERLVDHASLGVDYILSVEPDDTGTKLTYAWDSSQLWKMVSKTFFGGDRWVEGALTKFKERIEALP